MQRAATAIDLQLDTAEKGILLEKIPQLGQPEGKEIILFPNGDSFFR